jgi:hypothetical protein
MSATNPQVGSFIFLEGEGAPQKQSNSCMIVQNPAGAGVAAVIVPGRAMSYPARLRGTFTSVPDFRSIIGTQISYIKDGITVGAIVERADLQGGHWVTDPTTDSVVFMCAGIFSLVPLA